MKLNSTKRLIEETLGSDIKADLLKLFHENLGLIDNLEGVARRIGRTSKSVERDLMDLVRLGFLKLDGGAVSLNREKNESFQKAMAEYIKAVKR